MHESNDKRFLPRPLAETERSHTRSAEPIRCRRCDDLQETLVKVVVLTMIVFALKWLLFVSYAILR